MNKLFASLESRDGMERKRAREILTLIGDPAVSALQTHLTSSDKQLRWEAAKTLGAIIDPESIPGFISLLDDRRSDIRWLAGTALINLGPRSVAPVLQALTEGDITRGRADQSHRVLAELARDNGVLGEILSSVVELLRRNDTSVIASSAATALAELEKITGTSGPR